MYSNIVFTSTEPTPSKKLASEDTQAVVPNENEIAEALSGECHTTVDVVHKVGSA